MGWAERDAGKEMDGQRGMQEKRWLDREGCRRGDGWTERDAGDC